MTRQYPFQNPDLTIDQRLADLLPRMTLTEKCAQLVTAAGLEEGEPFSEEKARQHWKDGAAYINARQRPCGTRAAVRFLNAAQKFLREETRLGIPALGIGEGLHGFMANEATSFPQAIALASAWDPDLHERVFSATAQEMLSLIHI